MKKIILCVDDEISILKSLKTELKDTIGSDYKIETAEGGEDALELLEELLEEGHEIPLIIADYLMPTMRGDELLRRVHLSSPKTLKVMLTGQATVEAVGNAIKYAKLYRYIAKPWEPEDLRLTVVEAINSYLQDQKIEEKNLKLRELHRKQNELIEQLYENESHLMQFLEAIPVGVFIFDTKGRPYYINSRAQELLGQGIVCNLNHDKLKEIYEKYLENSQILSGKRMDILQRALKGEMPATNHIEIYQNDQSVYLEVWGTPIYDSQGNMNYAMTVFQDVTEQKKSAMILKQTEEKYRRIFENALEGIFQSTPEGQYISVNPALAHLYGYDSPEDLIQSLRNINNQIYVHPERRKELVRLMQEQGFVSGFESEVYCKDGSIIWITENARSVYDSQGNLAYYQGFVENISSRKKAEEERKKFIEELFELNCNLEISLETELKLTDASTRFVPNEFLSFLGYESIIDVKLGDAVEKEMSILFTDIRDFTALSESMSPQESFKFINSYLSHMEPSITENYGFIDKYIGDAIMALFGNYADDAVKAGISMLERLKIYNQNRMNLGEMPIEIGIGINTGSLILGIVGGKHRMDGTVISDAVNVSSRIEGLTKLYKVPLIITEQTVLKLKNPGNYHLRMIDEVQVKGKSESIILYEVFNHDLPPIQNGKLETLDRFQNAILTYQQKEFQQAEILFSECLKINPQDSVVRLYIKRCQQELKINNLDRKSSHL